MEGYVRREGTEGGNENVKEWRVMYSGAILRIVMDIYVIVELFGIVVLMYGIVSSM